MAKICAHPRSEVFVGQIVEKEYAIPFRKLLREDVLRFLKGGHDAHLFRVPARREIPRADGEHERFADENDLVQPDEGRAKFFVFPGVTTNFFPPNSRNVSTAFAAPSTLEL